MFGDNEILIPGFKDPQSWFRGLYGNTMETDAPVAQIALDEVLRANETLTSSISVLLCRWSNSQTFQKLCTVNHRRKISVYNRLLCKYFLYKNYYYCGLSVFIA